MKGRQTFFFSNSSKENDKKLFTWRHELGAEDRISVCASLINFSNFLKVKCSLLSLQDFIFLTYLNTLVYQLNMKKLHFFEGLNSVVVLL